MKTTPLITGEELIGDVISQYPGSAQIMEDFGLHCTSCSVNAFEPLRLGALSHGLEEAVVDDLIERLNDLAAAKQKSLADGFYLSPRAADQVKKFAEMEDKAGYALRITAKDNNGMEPAYGMDFEKEPQKDDKALTFHGVTVLMDPESWKNLEGAEVDFLETSMGSGFKITNPQFKAGGCGSGSCGCGTGHGSGGCGEGGCC